MNKYKDTYFYLYGRSWDIHEMLKRANTKEDIDLITEYLKEVLCRTEDMVIEADELAPRKSDSNCIIYSFPRVKETQI